MLIPLVLFHLFSHSYAKIIYGSFHARTHMIRSNNPRWNSYYNLGEVGKSAHYQRWNVSNYNYDKELYVSSPKYCTNTQILLPLHFGDYLTADVPIATCRFWLLIPNINVRCSNVLYSGWHCYTGERWEGSSHRQKQVIFQSLDAV